MSWCLCVCKHRGWWEKQHSDSSDFWWCPGRQCTWSHSQPVNRHEANTSCFLCLVKLLFSFKLRILQLFSNTITWKVASSLRRQWLEELQSVTWVSCNLCKRLVFCRRWPNAMSALQISGQRCLIRISRRLFQLCWAPNIHLGCLITCFGTENYPVPCQVFLTLLLTRQSTLAVQSGKDQPVCKGN